MMSEPCCRKRPAHCSDMSTLNQHFILPIWSQTDGGGWNWTELDPNLGIHGNITSAAGRRVPLRLYRRRPKPPSPIRIREFSKPADFRELEPLMTYKYHHTLKERHAEGMQNMSSRQSQALAMIGVSGSLESDQAADNASPCDHRCSPGH